MTTITTLQTTPLLPPHPTTRTTAIPSSRTVGTISHDPNHSSPGYNLFSQGKETYLINNDGQTIHSWRSHRRVFCAYLLPNGNLLRDGSDTIEAGEPFQTGGAAGYIECVTWDNELVWSWAADRTGRTRRFLTHHDIEPLANGGCLVLCWERRGREEALAVGRDPELIPDGEVWDDRVVELRPDGRGGAEEVWSWRVWDRLCQDRDPAKPNYVTCRSEASHRIDINLCPVGGKQACRDRTAIGQRNVPPSAHSESGKTGEKDWLHINSVSYHQTSDVVLLSLCPHGELIAIHRPSGNIVWRWGSPANYGGGTRLDQRLFCQHAAHFIVDNDNHGSGDGYRVLLFNNGRKPDRHWSSVDEIRIASMRIPDTTPFNEPDGADVDAELTWTYGPPANHLNSFYCTHISSVQRLSNGNTLVTRGPQGIISEINPRGEEVWRYVSPVRVVDGGVVECVVRQGEPRGEEGRYSLFCFRRYDETFEAFSGRDIVPGRYLEG